MQPLHIIKIGGNVLDHPAALDEFLAAFAHIEGMKILVHGGGKIATAIGEQLGIVSHYVHGRRITDKATLDLVTMVYGGLLNKQLVARLQSLRCNAIGVTGADANLIPAVKRPVKEVDYGYAGDVCRDAIPSERWVMLLHSGLVPVVAPLTHDGKGSLLNTNADTMAQEVGNILSPYFAVTIIYSFEKSGVLLDSNDETTVIASLDLGRYQALRESGAIHSGMIPKLDNAFAAMQQGVQKVVIGKAADLSQLLTGKKGTTLVNQ